MKSTLSRSKAKDKIDNFFKKESFSSEEMRKIKRLAMKHKIRLGSYRKMFCKRCLSKLNGKTRISKNYKKVECSKCRFINRIKIS